MGGPFPILDNWPKYDHSNSVHAGINHLYDAFTNSTSSQAHGGKYVNYTHKLASKAQAARSAKRIADKDLKRRRIPGDPQLGQRAEFTLTNATNFKRPAHITLGKSESAPVLKDWLKSLVQDSKFNVQFACDWKSAQNKRTISWHCFRHNMCSWRRSFGLDASSLNSTNNTVTNTDDQVATAGYVTNCAWPQWMDPFDPTDVYDWVGESSTVPNLDFGTTVNGVYSNLPYKNFMLRPDNNTVTLGTNIQNETTTGNINGGFTAKQSVSSPFIPQLHNRVYYSPINVSDIEDECYRNNRIVNQSQFDPVANTPLASDTLLKNAHRCVSQIGQSNVKYDITPGVSPYVIIDPPTVGLTISATGSSRNQQKSLIQNGNVNYKFINKADGPCKVEIIVWKFKTTHVAPGMYSRMDSSINMPAGGKPTTDSRYYMQFGDSTPASPVTAPSVNPALAGTPAPVCNAIQSTLDRYNEAYFKAVTSKYGSDNMAGRVPKDTDLFDNPNFPLFKKYSKYFQESLCDFSEHSRYTYPLGAGQRQEVNIKLPGEHYNPCSVGKDFDLNTSQTSGDIAPHQIYGAHGFSSAYGENPINPFNKFTYFIMIATSGCNMSASFDKGIDGNSYGSGASVIPDPVGPDHIEVGSAWSSSHVQAYGIYTENIGAMSTKIAKRNLYNLGGLVEADVTGNSTGPADSKPVDVYNLTIGPRIPIDRIVRLPPQTTVHRIEEGNTTNGMQPGRDTSSSGNTAATKEAAGFD